MSGIDPKQNSHTGQMTDYRRSMKEARDNFEKRVQDIENRAEKLNNKKDIERNETITDVRKNYESNLANHKNTLERNFIENRKTLNDKMEHEKRTHAKNTGELTKKYYERLEDINEKHQKNGQELEGNYRENLDIKSRTQDKVLKEQSINSSKKYQALKDDYDLKEDKLIENQQSQMRKVMRDAENDVSTTRKTEKKKVEDARSKSQSLYEDIKKNSELESNTKDQMYNNRLSEIQKNYKLAQDDTEFKNKNLTKESYDKFNSEMRKINLENDAKTAQLSREFSEKNRINNYLREKEKNFQDLNLSKTGLSPKEGRLQNQIRTYQDANQKLRNDLDAVGADYSDRLTMANFNGKKIRDNLIESKDRQAQAFLDKTLIDERGKQDQVKRSLENKMSSDKNEADIKRNQIEKTLKNRVDSLNQNYSATMKDVEEKNNLLVSNIKHQNKVDRKDYAERVDRDYNGRQIETLKLNQSKLDLQQKSFENQRMILDKQVAEKEIAFDTQLGRLREQSNSNMAVQYDIMNRQKEDTKISLKENAKRKEDDLKSTIEILHSKYARKLNQQEQKFEKQMYSMVQGYESKIRQMGRDNARELAMKASESIRDKKHMSANNEMDKKRLVEYYENLLQNMKTNYEREFDRLKNFLAASSEHDTSGS